MDIFMVSEQILKVKCRKQLSTMTTEHINCRIQPWHFMVVKTFSIVEFYIGMIITSTGIFFLRGGGEGGGQSLYLL